MSTFSKSLRFFKRVLKHDNDLKRPYGSGSNTVVWSKEQVVYSPFRDIQIPKVTISDYIWRNLDRWPNKTATVCGVSGRSYTYSELYTHSRILAARLRSSFNVSEGDVVCVMMRNVPEYPLVVLAVLQAGGILTTVNPVYTAYEVSRQLALSNAKLIITMNEATETLTEALQMNQQNIPILSYQNDNETTPNGVASLNEAISTKINVEVLNVVERNFEDIAFLPYSSGTTGLPKGVELTHRNIVANCEQQNDENIRQYELTCGSYQDKVLVVLPLFHIYGMTILMLHKLSVGAQLVMVPMFQSSTFPDILSKHKISVFYAAPPLVVYLHSYPGIRSEHLDCVKLFMCAASPLSIPDVEKLFHKLNRKLDFVQGYGLTETSPLLTLNTRGSENFASVGYPVPNTMLKIVNENSDHLGPGEVGELLVKGPQVMKGYKDNATASEQALTADGWFRTGDLANVDQSGKLLIHDRLKELIKVKGFQVPPAELEGVLKEHPDILDAAVIGIPDLKLGEAPKAFIVLRAGVTRDEQAISTFVAQRVADYKRIQNFVFVEELPKNASGKILKRVLKEM